MILVFGKTGQVATELQRQASVTALGRDDADLSDPDACAAAIAAHRPDVVINAAAYTAVDAAEENEEHATIINAKAPGAMASTCADLGIPFVHVSTDYVFDGSGTKPWQETDMTAPLNAYGRSKLAGEQAISLSGGQWAVLRTSWVFSAHGGNFVKSMLRLAESRDHLTIVADQVGGPTPAADIAATLLTMAQAMQGGQRGGLYHYGGQPHVSWADFARAIFATAGRSVTVEDIPTSGYPTPAQRPANSRLDGAKLLADFGIAPPDWQKGLARVLQDLA
ncbi:MAG TPA: dTDP-4-dehydrorhamnose reductase [Roseovarius sp.]|nr:dTDP-4-dehydrorhamnose reductase [Roseovarius sp.]